MKYARRTSLRYQRDATDEEKIMELYDNVSVMLRPPKVCKIIYVFCM